MLELPVRSGPSVIVIGGDGTLNTAPIWGLTFPYSSVSEVEGTWLVRRGT